MQKYFTIAFILFVLFFNCSILSDSQNGIIHYYGFDFSGNGYNANENKNDIVFIRSSSDNIPYIFISPFSNDSNFIKNLGDLAFNSIDRINDNTVWDSIVYVFPGHLYIAKCYDGYVKFKIISVSGTTLYNTVINIIFEYSNNSEF